MRTLLRDIGELLTLSGVVAKDGRRPSEADLGIQSRAAMIIENGKVTWTGDERRLPRLTRRLRTREVSLGGRTVLPAFVECHTHLVFGGHRRDEFELRCQGATYQEIARRGGGIRSTVQDTRRASVEVLRKLAQARTNTFVRQGVTTLEVKSGYGLDLKSELKILEVAQSLKGPRVVTTFLGPHAIAPEHKSAESYLKYLITKVLPEVARRGLAERVDMFVESGYFSPAQAERWFAAARNLGLKCVAHAEQLSHQGGTDVALAADAVSVDHVVKLKSTQIRALANTGTTAVLLPAADLYLKIPYAPARKLLQAGARVALATDFNPGSSPTQDLSLVGTLARLEMRMSLPEVIAAYTYNAAAALGRHHVVGALTPSRAADFIVLDDDWRSLFHAIGHHPVREVWRAGRQLTGPVH